MEYSNETEADKFSSQKDRYKDIRVLLVEDNELNAEIAVELLKIAGMQVETACDGQVAVDMVRKSQPYYYDFIFMDIKMPNKNGYEATMEIRAMEREDLKEIPIVALSANSFLEDVQKSIASGMNDHVAKPVELYKLTDAIDKWVFSKEGSRREKDDLR